MGLRTRPLRVPGRHLAWAAGALLAGAGLVALAIPTGGGATSEATPRARATTPADPASKASPAVKASPAGQAFTGVAAVGALFPSGGKHFCTASVVHSPAGDLAVTAAHCVGGHGSSMVFVPGFHDGQAPYGTWPVTRVYTDAAWQSSQDPDDDVAFLQLGRTAGVPVENVTGSEAMAASDDPGADDTTPALVQVIGYPQDTDQPVWCVNWAHAFSATQREFDCGGYRNGTSGGPFLTDVDPKSGQGTVIGVIGGYEQGGDTDAVSYAAVFGPNVVTLYQIAISSGG
jgi:V8-like Glu-specific endopeptidase